MDQDKASSGIITSKCGTFTKVEYLGVIHQHQLLEILYVTDVAPSQDPFLPSVGVLMRASDDCTKCIG